MTESILNTIKKMLGVPVEDSAFDSDVLVHINGALSTLTQLGVGPVDPILVANKDTEWSSLTIDPTVQGMAKQFIYLTVKLLFDPPSTSFVIESYAKTIQELTWRLEVQANPYIPVIIVVEEE